MGGDRILSKLRKDRRATGRSAVAWSVAALLLIGLAVPMAIWGAEAMGDVTGEEVYHEVTHAEDWNQDGAIWDHSNANGPAEWKYTNSSGNQWSEGSFYTANETGDNNTWLIDILSDDSTDNFDDSDDLYMGINYSTEQAIDDDLSTFSLQLATEAQGNFTTEIVFVDDDDDEKKYIVSEKEIEANDSMSEYEFDIDAADLLEADSALADNDSSIHSLVVHLADDNDTVRAGHSWDIGIDLVRDSSISKFWTAETVAAIAGIGLIVSAIFATPWVDLSDLTGKRKGKFWR